MSRSEMMRGNRNGVKHGCSRTRTYVIWVNMRSRCNNPNTVAYHRYGGRGIRVCARWDSYENFLTDMGEAPAGMTLERIRNSRGYSPSNCRWATRKEQSRNIVRNRMVTFRGERLCVSAWAERFGVKANYLHYWVASGQVRKKFNELHERSV